MNILKIKDYLKEKGYPDYRFKQIIDFIFSGKSSFDDFTTLPKSLRNELLAKFQFYSVKVIGIFNSKNDDAFKFLFELKDNTRIESMLFNKGNNEWVVCVSTQVGCPVRCRFCASGKKGFKRNLDWEEIFDQVLFLKNYLIDKKLGELKKVVYMGIGEPFFNYNNVIKSIDCLNKYLRIGKRNISVSTFGHIPRIRDFAKDMPQVNLAISLHSAIQEGRNKLLPLSSKYPLNKLAKAIRDYLIITGRKVFIEYVMLRGVNDREKDATKICEFIDMSGERKYFTVNLIPYNDTGSGFNSSTSERIREFSNLLIAYGIECTIRKSYGFDIKGACGQLAGW